MTAPHASDLLPRPTPPIVTLSAFALFAGIGGMAVSFLFLTSRSHLDVIAGAVGFLGGVILVATGLLSLAVQSRSSGASQAATNVAGCMVAALPPVVAILGWPALYFGAFLAVIWMPFVMLGCIGWAWVQSRGVALHLSSVLGWRCARTLRAIVFAIQLIAILGSIPLFAYFLHLLESMGYKVGWS